MTSPYTGRAAFIDGIPTVGTTAERDARYPTPPDDFKVMNLETNAIEYVASGAWITGADVTTPAVRTINAASSRIAGSDLFAKITNAIAALPATGGVVDATEVTTTTAPSSALTIAKKGVTVLLPTITLTSAFGIVVSPGVHAVTLKSSNSYGLFGSGVPGFTLLYTGSGNALLVGTSASQTNGFWLENCCMDVELGGANAIGLTLANVVGYRIDTCRFIRSAAQAGQRSFVLDGTGGYTGVGLWINPIANAPAIFTGAGAAAANHNVFLGGNISLSGSGTCVTIDQDSNGNLFVGTDFENASVGLQDNSLGYNAFEGCRVESVTTGYAAGAANVNGSIIRCTTPIAYTDATGASTVEYPGFKAQGGRVVTRYATAAGRITPSESVLVSGVDAQTGNTVQVTLTAGRTVGAPLNPTSGQTLTFTLVQNGTGGFAVAWNAAFKGLTWSNTGNTANTRSSVSFTYDGTNWNQTGAQAPWAA